MSTLTYEESSADALLDDGALEYRALHVGAIAGLVLGLLSVFTIITAAGSLEACLLVCPIPLVGIFVSLRAWAQIVRQQDQYTGSKLALVGLGLSSFFLVSGVAYGAYVYATEVPDGYQRISFSGMKPNARDQRASVQIPQEIADLEGQKVFIKGYIRPDSMRVRTNAKGFLLVRDNNQCCFGDVSKVKYYDQVIVAMQGSLSVDYTSRILRMGGTLHVHPENIDRGPGAPVFTLDADYVK